jgi:hypothetical protein
VPAASIPGFVEIELLSALKAHRITRTIHTAGKSISGCSGRKPVDLVNVEELADFQHSASRGQSTGGTCNGSPTNMQRFSYMIARTAACGTADALNAMTAEG